MHVDMSQESICYPRAMLEQAGLLVCLPKLSCLESLQSPECAELPG